MCDPTIGMKKSEAPDLQSDDEALREEAREYLLAQPWCDEIEDLTYRDGFEKVAVFYARVRPLPEGEMGVWVVVGDLPPLYVSTNGGMVTTPAEALFLYAGKLIRWLDAVREETTGPMVPILLRRWSLRPLEPTPAHLDLVDRRIALLFGCVIPWVLNEPDYEEQTLRASA